jgi:hypothetical protein
MNSGPILSSFPAAMAGHDRLDGLPSRAAPVAATDLPGEKAVTLARETDPALMRRQASPGTVPGDSDLVRRYSIDTATRLVVSSTVERDTGRVLNQFPEQAVLQRKAYFRQMREQAAADRGGQSDTRA